MGWFTPSKRVTEREMRDVRGGLRSKGFSETDIRNLNKMASGDIGEGGLQKGMDKREVERLLKNLDQHPSWHSFSDNQKKQLKEALEKKLGKTNS